MKTSSIRLKRGTLERKRERCHDHHVNHGHHKNREYHEHSRRERQKALLKSRSNEFVHFN